VILLPIGHEEESTRRLPWVTLGIMILCVVAFFATGFGGSRTESAAIDAMDGWRRRRSSGWTIPTSGRGAASSARDDRALAPGPRRAA